MKNARPHLSDVRASLARDPLLLGVFDRLVGALADRGDVGLSVTGSLAGGTIDQWSDLDIEIVLPEGASVPVMLDWVKDVARISATPLCYFPADHVGLDQILVFFFLEDGKVVKADLHVLELSEYVTLRNTKLIVDPGFVSEALGRAPRPAPSYPDFEDLHMKFCGWIWYTYTKVVRGELLEGFDSLQVMRVRALVPSLQCVHGLPYEGFRRLEMRLPSHHHAALRATIPTSTDAPELYRALLSMCRLFAELQPMVAVQLGRDHQRADLTTMVSIVERLVKPG